MHDTRYFLVSGRVQGVFFRGSARDMARALGLRGWIRNRDDGHVDGMACGHAAALLEFHDWLSQGPANAQVERVVFEPAPAPTPVLDDDFVIR